jgi:hypothetical protein
LEIKNQAILTLYHEKPKRPKIGLLRLCGEGGIARHSLAAARSFLVRGGAKCSSAFVGVRFENFLLKIF